MSRPATCKHLLWPTCGCQPPPALASHLILERDRKVKAAMEEAAKPKKAGRPKTVWTRDPTDEEQFLETLPDVVEDPYSRQKLLMLVDASLCRQSFSEFVRQAWHVVEPTTTLEWNWHHEFICSVLQGLFEDWEHAKLDPKFKARVLNTIFNVPPGSLKSRLLCVMFPVWCWLRKPGMKFLCLSVNEQAAHRDARDARSLIVSDWFQNMFIPDWQLKDDQTAISNYGTTKGGIRLSKALGAEVVGQRADCFAYSTPVQTTWGPVAIGKLHEWFEAGKPVPDILSYNHTTGVTEYRPLQATRKILDRPTIEVDIGWSSLMCTPDHKFYSKGEYRAAQEISTGYAVDTDGKLHEVNVSSHDLHEVHDVYDIQVEGNHNFFAEGLLVHNCLILDDPNNPKESESKVVREGINETWKTNIFNRINHPETSMRIGIQQRVHSEDWTGFVTNPDNGAGLWSPTNRLGWLLVALPAEFEPERKCITPWGSDIRTEKGQPLHDVRMTPEFLEAEKKRFGSQGYAGQMQQRPTLAEGGTVKMRWWRYFHYEGQTAIAPSERKLSDEQNKEVHSREVKKTHGYGARWDFDWTAISLDPAAKATERGSQHGILVISGKGPQRFIRADKTFRGDVLEVIRVMLQLCKEYDPNRILIEAKAAGPALMTMFEERFQRGEVVGMDGRPLRVVVDSIEPMGDKMARVDSCLPEIESGLVHLWDGADWLKPFVEEVCGFPLASYDDRIDSLSQCLNHMRSWNSYQLPSW